MSLFVGVIRLQVLISLSSAQQFLSFHELNLLAQWYIACGQAVSQILRRL
jgi:hypothetical protein